MIPIYDEELDDRVSHLFFYWTLAVTFSTELPKYTTGAGIKLPNI